MEIVESMGVICVVLQVPSPALWPLWICLASFEQRELKSEILFKKLRCGSGSDGDGMVKVKSNGKIMQLLKKKLFMLKMVSLVLFSCLSSCFFFCQDFFLVSSFFFLYFL